MEFNCPFCYDVLTDSESHGQFGESIYECLKCKKEFRLIVGELKESEVQDG